jgi:hypothetical protein
MQPFSTFVCVPCFCLSLALFSFAQTSRRAELIANGLSFIDKGRFTDAVNALEEAWEQSPNDPTVAENLAMGYLYADRDYEKALKLATFAIENGGRASFLMQHPHERVKLLSGEMADYCSGRFTIQKGRMAFTSATEQAHSFSVEGSNFKEIQTNRAYGGNRGMFHVKTVNKTNYNFRPKTWSEAETRLVFHLLEKYLKS